MTNDWIREYCGFVNLNNLAVTLIEQGKYVEARETLNDAITVMKNALRIVEASAEGEEDMIDSDVDQKLHKAFLSCLPSGGKHSNYSDVANFYVLNQPVQGISNKPISFVDHSRNNFQNKPILVRIEVYDFSFHEDNEVDFDFETAILLHNFGITYMCLQQQATEGNDSRCIKSAAHMLHLSQSLLEKLIESANEDDSAINHIDYESYLLMESIVIHTIISKVLIKQNHSVENDHYKVRLSWLVRVGRRLTLKMNQFLESAGPQGAAAA